MSEQRYIVIADDSQADFEQLVSQRIEQGWQPSGGVFVQHIRYEANYNTYEETWYYQAMVKEDVKKINDM